MFDFTHNLKKIINNFVNKQRLIPTPRYNDIHKNPFIALFSHIKQLYALEEHKTAKIAHTLKKASLNPRNSARTSQHALNMYSLNVVSIIHKKI